MIEIELSSGRTLLKKKALPAVIDYDDSAVLGVEFLIGDLFTSSIDWDRTVEEAQVSISYDRAAGAAYIRVRDGHSRYQLSTDVQAEIDELGVLRSVSVDDEALPHTV
jgi:hypothetical protein